MHIQNFCDEKSTACLKFRRGHFLKQGVFCQALISYFQTFCDNEGLLKSLNEVKKKRDYLAHQGYLLTFEEQNDPKFVSDQLVELESAYMEAKACFSALQGEMERIHNLAESTAKGN